MMIYREELDFRELYKITQHETNVEIVLILYSLKYKCH